MIIEEIINGLRDPNGSLTGALLSTKVLLRQIRREDLTVWVNSELTGYDAEDRNIPSYRAVSMKVYGNLATMTFRMNNQPLGIAHLEEDEQKWLTSYLMPSSIAVLEAKFKDRSVDHRMVRNLPPEGYHKLSKALAAGVHVDHAWCEVNLNDVENILIEVRSRLLDFILDLRKAFGADADEQALSEKARNVDTGKMFSAAIYGSGNTVVMGVHSTQTVSAKNSKGDLEGMARALADAGIPADELYALRDAVVRDEQDGLVPVVKAGETGKWYLKLFERAVKGTVDVSLDVVSSVVAKVIADYAGLPPV